MEDWLVLYLTLKTDVSCGRIAQFTFMRTARSTVLGSEVLESKNRVFGKVALYEMPFWKSFEIDEPEDIELCEFYFKERLIYDYQNRR